jgi:signal transduction histidine kinase/DNA-binding response OmpR family regulator
MVGISMSSTMAIVLIACVSAGLGALGVLIASWVRARDFRRPPPGLSSAGVPPQAIDLEFRGAELAARERTLRAAERFRNLLISKLSHDVHTPLNSMITLSQLLADGSTGPLTADQHKYAEVIHRGGRQLLSLINDVLDLSHIEIERLDLQLAPVDIRPLMRGAGAAQKERARTKGLALHLNPPPTPLLVDADEDRLRQVLGTLVARAVEETSNGYVELSADVDGQQVTMRISDTGPGATPELRRADFETFLVQDGGRPPGPALILAGRLVKLMGGTITVDSAAGEGTAISLSLPRSSAHTAAPVPAPTATAASASASALGAPGHILLVEDDAMERERVADLLLGAGYRISVASSGQEGLTQLRVASFDAVVLDLVMPGMTGLDLLRAVRADERLAATPFVVLSALYMTRSEREVLGPTVIAVIRKGEENGEELITQVARACAARPLTDSVDLARAAPERMARVLLVVEDDGGDQQAIEHILASLPITIETASTAQEAIESCRRQPPDLIVMEADLPSGSGLDAGAEIRRLPDCARIPIIALTAANEPGGPGAPSGRDVDFTSPCGAYLSKPINPGDVVSAVTRALQLGVH